MANEKQFRGKSAHLMIIDDPVIPSHPVRVQDVEVTLGMCEFPLSIVKDPQPEQPVDLPLFSVRLNRIIDDMAELTVIRSNTRTE